MSARERRRHVTNALLQPDLPFVTLASLGARGVAIGESDYMPPEPPSGPGSVVFDAQILEVVLAECVAGHSGEDHKRQLSGILRRVRSLGAWRPRAKPHSMWVEMAEQLRNGFPNFRQVIDEVIEPHVALVAAGAEGARMVPTLLVGPPGVGKTHFARSVAELFGAPIGFLDIAACQTSGDLAGSSSFWANWAPGLIFKALGWGLPGVQAVCDPLILLDEVDKCSADRYDPLGPLYGLLERASAAVFEDQSVKGLTLNASLVRWILTANDVGSIPKPILSRTRLFHIAPPTSEQMLEIAQSQFRRIVHDAKLPFPFDPALPSEIAQTVGSMSPREIGIRLEIALGKAVAAGRQELLEQDWASLGDLRRAPRMGFC